MLKMDECRKVVWAKLITAILKCPIIYIYITLANFVPFNFFLSDLVIVYHRTITENREKADRLMFQEIF